MSSVRKLHTVFLLGLGGLGLAACQPAQLAEVQPAAPEPVTCDASFYTYLKGEPISVVDTLNTGVQVRVLAADSFVTKDFEANRLTFTTSPDGTVSRIFCG
ncbi:I78 family peptidase inhibitor [Pseudoruegeria sp. SK021]|uniref:I78 family peptidase inhibitor n=1 Tax=Pseudoruegeria sp. SK021 TaxID=1933035 RepID=UPI000A21E00B|nr:I78 family peptidase inhibitor [Pseudoruegeria sp. SK021]OSP56790.1 hypothetical protein BV911_02280 [Pseudoruegeria sp. SK021]